MLQQEVEVETNEAGGEASGYHSNASGYHDNTEYAEGKQSGYHADQPSTSYESTRKRKADERVGAGRFYNLFLAG